MPAYLQARLDEISHDDQQRPHRTAPARKLHG